MSSRRYKIKTFEETVMFIRQQLSSDIIKKYKLDDKNLELYYGKGCAEEALLHLRRDDSYSGEVMSTTFGVCDIVVSGVLNNRTVTITGTFDDLTIEQSMMIILSSLSIVTWDN